VEKGDDRDAGIAMGEIVSFGRSRRFRQPSGWHAALLLRLARVYCGKSPREFASDLSALLHLAIIESTVRTWEVARPPPPPHVVDAAVACTGLDVEGLLEQSRIAEPDPEGSAEAAGAPQATVEHDGVLAIDGDELLARLGVALEQESLERLGSALAGRHAPDARIAGSLEALLSHMRAQDDLLGPRVLLPAARSLLYSIDDITRDATSTTQRSLLSVAAQYEQFIGWLWVDIGAHEEARRAYDTAIVRAVESGNRALAGYLLACKSEQALMAGQPTRSVRLAREARSGPWRMSAIPLAWANDLEARASAVLGKSEQCNRRLDRSAELLARRAEEPPWAYHYIDKVLEVHTAMCLTDLAVVETKNAQRAIEIFDQAIAAVAPTRVRDRAYYLACAAQAHARNRQPERAAEVALEATTLAAETNSTRVLKNLSALRGTLRDHEDLKPVREFVELLDSLIRA